MASCVPQSKLHKDSAQPCPWFLCDSVFATPQLTQSCPTWLSLWLRAHQAWRALPSAASSAWCDLPPHVSMAPFLTSVTCFFERHFVSGALPECPTDSADFPAALPGPLPCLLSLQHPPHRVFQLFSSLLFSLPPLECKTLWGQDYHLFFVWACITSSLMVPDP